MSNASASFQRSYAGAPARRLVESAVGAHLADAVAAGRCEVSCWCERNRGVDFVEAFKPKRTRLVGGDGIPIEEFLLQPVEH